MRVQAGRQSAYCSTGRVCVSMIEQDGVHPLQAINALVRLGCLAANLGHTVCCHLPNIIFVRFLLTRRPTAQNKWDALAKDELRTQKKRTSAKWTDEEEAAVHEGVIMYALFAAPRHMCTKQLVLPSALQSLLEHPVAALCPGRHACLNSRMRCSRFQAVDDYGMKHLRLGDVAGSGGGGTSS